MRRNRRYWLPHSAYPKPTEKKGVPDYPRKYFYNHDPRPAIRYGLTKPHYRNPRFLGRGGTFRGEPFPYRGLPILGHPDPRSLPVNLMWWRWNRLGQHWVMPKEG